MYFLYSAGAGSIAQHSVRSKHSAISKHQDQGSEKSTMLGSDVIDPVLVISYFWFRVTWEQANETWVHMVQDEKAGVSGNDEMRQRINNLQERRKCDKINLILYAAARGDLVALKDVMEVKAFVFS